MKKLTFQKAKELNLVFEIPKDHVLEDLIDDFHQKLNQSKQIKEYISSYVGDSEEIIYLLANNFESITMHDLKNDINIFTPEVLVVFTSKRILIFKNLKNKAYYRNKNQIPGFERGFHLFDSCFIIKYNRIEQVYIEKNTLNLYLFSTPAIDKYEKNEKSKLVLETNDFNFEVITKIFGNYM